MEFRPSQTGAEAFHQKDGLDALFIHRKRAVGGKRVIPIFRFVAWVHRWMEGTTRCGHRAIAQVPCRNDFGERGEIGIPEACWDRRLITLHLPKGVNSNGCTTATYYAAIPSRRIDGVVSAIRGADEIEADF